MPPGPANHDHYRPARHRPASARPTRPRRRGVCRQLRAERTVDRELVAPRRMMSWMAPSVCCPSASKDHSTRQQVDRQPAQSNPLCQPCPRGRAVVLHETNQQPVSVRQTDSASHAPGAHGLAPHQCRAAPAADSTPTPSVDLRCAGSRQPECEVKPSPRAVRVQPQELTIGVDDWASR